MTQPKTEFARGIVRPTQHELTIAIYAIAASIVLAGIGALLVWNVGAHFVRSVFFGLGAGVLSILASIQIVQGFRRSVGRAPEPVTMGVLRVRSRRTGDLLPGSGRQLRGVDLSGANLIDTHLVASDLVAAHLDGANLSYASLNRALASGARLMDAVLQGTSLKSADLRGADLTRADLTRANLGNADLSKAQLEGAVLRDADLRRANFSEADLRRVDFAGASLDGARLAGADCRGAALAPEQLDQQQLRDAVTNEEQPGFTQAVAETSKHARSRFGKQ